MISREYRVAFSDIDGNKHLNNVAVVRIFQDTRVYLLDRLRDAARTRLDGYVVIVHVGFDFKAEARLGEVLVAGVTLGARSARSFRLEFTLKRASDGLLVSAAEAVLCVVSNRGTGAVPLTDAALQAALDETATVRITEKLARL